MSPGLPSRILALLLPPPSINFLLTPSLSHGRSRPQLCASCLTVSSQAAPRRSPRAAGPPEPLLGGSGEGRGMWAPDAPTPSIDCGHQSGRAPRTRGPCQRRRESLQRASEDPNTLLPTHNPKDPSLTWPGAPLSGPFLGEPKPDFSERGTYCRGLSGPPPPHAALGCAQLRRQRQRCL